MKKLLKISATIVAVVIFLALTAPLLFRGAIERVVLREANERLEAHVAVERLGISFFRHFPMASLELKGLTVDVAGQEGRDTLLAARRLSVVVDPLSLLGDEGFRVRKVSLVEPLLSARKARDGAVNWNILKAEAEPQPQAAPDAGAEAADTSSFRLLLDEVSIVRASIRYADDSSRVRFAVDPLSLRLRGDLSARRSDLDLRLDARGVNLASAGIPLLSEAEAELKALLTADLEHGRIVFDRNTFRLNAIELALDGWIERRGEGVAMDVRAGCGSVQFKDVLSLVPAIYTRDFGSLSAKGDLTLALWARGEWKGAQLPAFELKAGVEQGSFRYASLPKAVTDIRIAASVSNPGGGMDRTVVDLSRLRMTMADQTLAATFRATNLASDPALSFTADGRLDLGAIREVYPLERGLDPGGTIACDVRFAGRLSDVTGGRYERLAASGTAVVEQLALRLPALPAVTVRRAAATLTPRAMTLGELDLQVGQSDLAAKGQLTDYIGYFLRGEKLSGRLYVDSGLLDLNEIMAAAGSGNAGSGKGSAAPAAPDTAARTLPIPRNLDLSLHADLKKVLLRQMILTNIRGEMAVAQGAVALDRLTMHAFGGRATASGRYATAPDPARPKLRLAFGVEGASFARTFSETETVQRLAPIFARTGGEYTLSLDLDAVLGPDLKPDLGTLDASGRIESRNIRLQQVAAFDALAKALGRDQLRRIEARDLAIRFAIRDGRIFTQPFDLSLAGLKIEMSGSTSLDGAIDYTARVFLPAGQGMALVESVDVAIGGTFSAPKLSLDARKTAERALEEAVVRRILPSAATGEGAAPTAETILAEAEQAGQRLIEAAEAGRDRLVEEAAKKGALAKIAAQKAGERLVEEARRQADRLRDEARRRIDSAAVR